MMKKIFLILVCTSFASFLFSDQTIPQRGYEPGHSIEHYDIKGSYSMPARVDVTGAWDTYLTGSFTYWQTLANDMYYGFYSNYHASENNIPATQHKHFADFNFKFHPGFKVTLGHLSKYDNWNVLLRYTWMNIREKRATGNSLDDIFLFQPWTGNFIVPNGLVKTSGHWRVKNHVGDLEIGRPYYLGRMLIFEPHLGLKGFFVYQRMYTHMYQNIPGGVLSYWTWNKCNSWGVGGRTGCNMSWLLSSDWRFFGSPAFALAYQQYTLKRGHKREDRDYDSVDYKDKKYAVVPIVELALGMGYGSYFNNYNWHFDISASYEFQVWFNQITMMAYAKSDSSYIFGANDYPTNNPYQPTNLMIHGLTVSAKLDF